MKKTFYVLTIVILNSCIHKEKCTISPIPNNVCDINDLTEHQIIFHSGKDTATLSLINKWDAYEEESISAIANKRDCQHSKGYECVFQDENILVDLIKDDNENLTLNLNSRFNSLTNSEIETTQEQIQNKDKFIFNESYNNTTTIKQVVLKGLIVESITTKDNKIWKP